MLTWWALTKLRWQASKALPLGGGALSKSQFNTKEIVLRKKSLKTFRSGWFVFFVLTVAMSIGFTGAALAALPPGPTYEDYRPAKMIRVNGEYLVEARINSAWRMVGALGADKYLRTMTLDLGGLAPENGALTLRITKQGGGHGHIDFVAVDGVAPSGLDEYNQRKLGAADFDVIHVPQEGRELTFAVEDQVATLSLLARIEPVTLSKYPYHLPLTNQNLYKNIEPQYYSYTLNSNRGSLNVDGALDRIAPAPLMRERTISGSGHPSGDIIAWVMNDDENLYVSIDWTSDNTRDGDADYTTVFVNTPRGLKPFKLSEADTTWGRPGYQYTDEVVFEHKVYEYKIPLAELHGADKTGAPLELAFTAYGTSAPANFDATLTKTASVSSASVGDRITYTISITNNENNGLVTVGVSDVFPSELSSIEWECNAGPQSSCPHLTGSGTLTNEYIDLAAQDSVTYTVTATVAAAGTITNTATLSYSTDTSSGNDSPTAVVTAVEKATLAVNFSGAGSGIISASPSGESTASSYSWKVTQGAAETLSAYPSQGASFAGWDVCPGTGPCVVSMESDTTVTAYFNLDTQQAPIADAGPNQVVKVSESVTLNGANSMDKDGQIASWVWSKVSGPSASLSNASSATATFTPGSEGVYVFRLVVTDNDGLIGVDEVSVIATDTKQPPVADAGPSQCVTSGTLTTLNGANSFDRDGTIASYAWEQLSGSTVTMSDSTAATLTFTPTVDGVYTFALTVTDNDGLTDSDVVKINVSTNKPPFAVAYSYIPESGTASIDLTAVAEVNTTVVLDGSNSVPRPGNSISAYLWEQVAGSPVTIADISAATTSFTASEEGAYRFKLTVTDSNGLAATDFTQINVLENNQAPTANAGADQNVALGASVTLNGGGSSDPDGSISDYAWEQLLGAPVTITNPDQAQASFTAPSSVSGMLFQLTVTDNDGAQDIDTVVVNATNGTPPAASAGGEENDGVVTLNGCSSTGDGLSYSWEQNEGPNMSLNDSDSCSPSFTPSSGTSVDNAALSNAALAAPAVDDTYSFTLTITDSDGLMSTSTASVAPATISGADLNHIIYRNSNTGRYAFLKLNDNGTLKNTTANDGIGMITTWDALNTFSFQAATQNGGSDTRLLIANADGSRYGWLKLNANGTLANQTNNDGIGWVHSQALDLSGWSLVGVQDNGSHAEGLNHLIMQNTGNGDLGFLKLNSNATIKNETGNDGFARINLGLSIPTTWRAFDIQENADGAGFDHILLRNTGTNKVVYVKLNSNGTLKNTTGNDGFGFLFPGAIPDYTPEALDSLTAGGLLFKNTAGGTRAFAYVKLNANGTIENLTRGAGWDFLQQVFDLSGFDVLGLTTINSENALLLRNSTGGRVAWIKLNVNGTAQNTTGNDGLAWVSEDYSPQGWRAESLDPTIYTP